MPKQRQLETQGTLITIRLCRMLAIFQPPRRRESAHEGRQEAACDNGGVWLFLRLRKPGPDRSGAHAK